MPKIKEAYARADYEKSKKEALELALKYLFSKFSKVRGYRQDITGSCLKAIPYADTCDVFHLVLLITARWMYIVNTKDTDARFHESVYEVSQWAASHSSITNVGDRSECHNSINSLYFKLKKRGFDANKV